MPPSSCLKLATKLVTLQDKKSREERAISGYVGWHITGRHCKLFVMNVI